MKTSNKENYHIKDTLKDIFKKIDNHQQPKINKEIIKQVWEKAAGSQAAKHSEPVTLRKHTLVINVDSTAWIYQLKTKQKEILKKIQKDPINIKLEKIQLRAGEVNK